MRRIVILLVALGMGPGFLRSQESTDPITELRVQAAAGEVASQRQLAARYAEGVGVTRDLALARRWYEQAAEAGDPESQTAMGLMLADAKGGNADPAQALRWFRQAAEQGYAPAQYWMGWMYLTGRGVEADASVAATWWRRAAQQGDASSQNNLGLLYEEGLGVRQDPIEAHAWLSLSGMSSVSALEDRMTPDQLVQARQRAEELKAVYAAMTNDQ